MKKTLQALALGLWVVAGTIFLSRLWYANPDRFPRFPDSFWRYIDQLSGASNVDEAKNIEFLVIVVVSFTAVVAITAIAATLSSHVKGKR